MQYPLIQPGFWVLGCFSRFFGRKFQARHFSRVYIVANYPFIRHVGRSQHRNRCNINPPKYIGKTVIKDGGFLWYTWLLILPENLGSLCLWAAKRYLDWEMKTTTSLAVVLGLLCGCGAVENGIWVGSFFLGTLSAQDKECLYRDHSLLTWPQSLHLMGLSQPNSCRLERRWQSYGSRISLEKPETLFWDMMTMWVLRLTSISEDSSIFLRG